MPPDLLFLSRIGAGKANYLILLIYNYCKKAIIYTFCRLSRAFANFVIEELNWKAHIPGHVSLFLGHSCAQQTFAIGP
jgi:hypothetical protein